MGYSAKFTKSYYHKTVYSAAQNRPGFPLEYLKFYPGFHY